MSASRAANQGNSRVSPPAQAEEDRDESLLRRVGARDEGAFERLVERHAGAAMGLARGLCAAADQAEDAVQEAFLHIWRTARSYRGPGNPRAWILTIVAHETLKRRRSMLNRTRHEQLAAAQKGQLDLHFAFAGEERFELLERLRTALARMAPRERELIRLYFEAGLSQQQIGARLAQSQRTVCRRLASSLDTMRFQLSRQNLRSLKEQGKV